MSKKKTPKFVSRALPILVLVLIGTNIATLYYFTVLDQSNILDIRDLTGENVDQYIGQTITVEGYVVVAGEFKLLVTHPENFWTDQLDASNHLLISGESSESIVALAGLWVRLTGTIQYEDKQEGFLGIVHKSHNLLRAEDVPLPGCNETYTSVDLLPDHLIYENIVPTKYAILFKICNSFQRWLHRLVCISPLLESYNVVL